MPRHSNQILFVASASFMRNRNKKDDHNDPRTTVHCPVPDCGKTFHMTPGKLLPWHLNRHGFTCDGTNRTTHQAARLEIDNDGKLIGVDDMKITHDPEE